MRRARRGRRSAEIERAPLGRAIVARLPSRCGRIPAREAAELRLGLGGSRAPRALGEIIRRDHEGVKDPLGPLSRTPLPGPGWIGAVAAPSRPPQIRSIRALWH